MVKRLMAGFGGALRIRTKAGGEEGQGSVVELVFRAERDAPTLSELPHPTASSRNSVDLAALAPASTTKPAPGSEHQVKPVQPPQSPQQAQPQSSSLPRPATALEASPSSSAPILPAPPAASLLPSTAAAQQPGNEETPAPSAVDVLARPRPDPPGASTDTPQANSLQALAQVRLSEASRTGFEQSEQLGETEAGVILIVDDDPLNLDILEDLLTPAGYTILTAASGNEALEVFVSADPPVQLVLLDVTLPDLSGHEVCTKMRSLSPGVPPPIIMISGKASTKDVVKGLQAGSSDYITKPFQPQEVLARVETQLRLYTGDLQALQETAERNIELLKQVLPPHILEPLRGGSRVLMEKFPEVCVLQAEIVGFSMLAAQSDTPDCILTLSRIYSLFDQLVDKHALHKQADQCRHGGCLHGASSGHAGGGAHPRLPGHPGQDGAEARAACGPSVCRRAGREVPQRLATALTALALPMTLHVSEAVYNRVHATLGGEMNLIPYTLSSFQGMGIIRTFLVPMACVDAEALASCSVADTMTRINAGQAAAGLQVGAWGVPATLEGQLAALHPCIA
ncbi:uncharacterized protein HaLaN_23188 [Haematococcus lacustris]|uniref:Response regulatory domain-containing protein n=1 Tax=Haematococcus lacustris TaxID=44745 RepID=A0A6A0A184_HAELA|nr:uncharacterized protein HaLaN_23188 [Haematococcus lacustris]